MSLERKLYITNNWVVFIFIYYTCLFFTGIYFSYDVFIRTGQEGVVILLTAFEGSAFIALTASSIAYIRKLYKLCFKYSSSQEKEDQIFLKRFGTITYFITRPIFAVAFSMLVVATLYLTFISSSSETKLDVGFVYLSMITSFYIGFLSGDFIKMLEEKGGAKFKDIV